jgi:C4-dicarboxylate transporter, DctM subunit
MTNRSKSFWDPLIEGCGLLGGALIPVAALCITYEVVMRYFFRAPTVWVSDVSIYLTVASVCLSVAYTLREKAHVRVDFITNHLSGRTGLILEIFTTLLGILYCVVLGWEGVKLAWSSYLVGEVPPAIFKMPMFIPKGFIALGATLLTIQLIRLLKNLIRAFTTEGKGPDSPSGSAFRQTWVTIIFAVLLIFSFVLLKASTTWGVLILFFLLLFCGIPVAFALGLFGLFCFYFLFGGAPMMVRIPIMAYSSIDNPVMVALPLFILTSTILSHGQVGIVIFNFANVLVRHLPGGLGIASIIFCGLFAAMTGSSPAVASAVSMIALPEMLSRGYDRKLVIGLLAAGGTLGILFPPSLALMLYGAMTAESLGSLFMAGLIPGLILTGMFCLYVAIVASRDKNIQRQPRASFPEIVKATKDAAGGLLTILIIIGGIYSGVFTPTESGGVAAIYTLVLCIFIYRTLSREKLKTALLQATRVSSMILLIIIGANIAGQAILLTQISQNILSFVKSMAVPPWVIMLCVNIFLIIMGGPLEAITILVIALPILYPLVTGLGFSGLWFGIIMVINMELALISPPEGLNLFILQNLAKSTAQEVTRGIIPFLIIMGLFLLLISLVPSLTTWLPSLMMQ